MSKKRSATSPNSEPDIVRTRKEAARRLDITEKQLGNDANEPWFPPDAVQRGARGRRYNWNVPIIRAARAAAKRTGVDPQLDEITREAKSRKAVEEAKKAELENEKREIALAVQKGELVPRAAVELFSATLLTALGDWCTQYPDIIAGELPAKHRKRIRNRMQDELDNRRRQLAADLEQNAREYDQKQAHTTETG